MDIQNNKYYKLRDLSRFHPILSQLKYYYLLKQVKEGKLKAFNTNKTGIPRFLIRGEDVQNFVKSMR